MKIKTLLFTAVMALTTLAAVAQTPMSFTYQAVVRNSSGQLVSNATVGVRISIIQGSLNGRAVYNSTQTTATNANGLLTIIIGNGQNPIDTINWANGPYYLKSEVDPAGGSNYTLSTVQQMLSVPYALHAHTVDNANFVEQQVLTMSGDTVSLTGGSFVVLPAGFSGNYNDLTNKPVLFSGDYDSLSNKPVLFSGVYDSLTNKPVLFSGDYDSLTNKPVLFSGVYDSLTNKPTNVSAFTNDAGYLTSYTETQVLSKRGDTVFLTGGSFVVLHAGFSGNYNDLTNKPHLFSGVYDSLTNKPVLFSGVYDSLTNKPTNVSTFTNDAGYLTNATLTERQKLSDVTRLNDSVNSQIKNLHNPTDSMDAVNLRTLNNYIAALIHHYDSIINNMARVIDTLRTLVSVSTPTVTPTPLPAGALSGLFSVGNGKQVRFSKGNLQWTATGTHATADSIAIGTWRFAEHQWDTIGKANDNISSSYTGWIDLFGWGTSGWNSGANAYQPYSNSLNYSDYYPGDTHTTDLYGAYANADWGVYNAISNGGNQPGMWRTLTNVEWDTLINLRNTTSGIRFAKANVSGVPGLIIVPDNWSNSTYALNSANTTTVNYTCNTITSSQWTILENAGCAFLPAAGFRNSVTPNTGNVAIAGYYWSSKCIATMSAYTLTFVVTSTSSSSIRVFSGNRNTGLSVRLVTDVH